MTGTKTAQATSPNKQQMSSSILVRAEAARRSLADDPALRRLANLAPTLFFELALGITVGLVGTAMAARVSDNAAAAFALANHVAAMLFILFRVVGAGVSVVITQNLGANRREAADGAARAVLGASTWLGLFSATMAVLFAWPLMRLLNAPADVLWVAAPFLQMLALPLLFDAWIASTAAVLRAHLFNRDTLLVVLVMHVLHLALAMPLMHGIGPIPALGLTGFAIAAGLSRLVALGLFMWLWKARLQLVPHLHDWWRVVRERLAPVLHIGLPAAAENVGYRLAFVVSVAAVGHMGAASLATQAYVLQTSYLALMFGLAIGFSVEIVVGHMIGARKWRDAQQFVKRTLAISLAVSLVATTVAASAASWLLGHFTRDPAIIDLGVKLLWMTIALELGRTFNLVVINALRATGDARFPVMAGSASMLVVLAGGSWFFGVTLGWGLAGVWVAYAADEWIRGLIMWRRWATYGWLPQAKSSRRRARRERSS